MRYAWTRDLNYRSSHISFQFKDAHAAPVLFLFHAENLSIFKRCVYKLGDRTKE